MPLHMWEVHCVWEYVTCLCVSTHVGVCECMYAWVSMNMDINGMSWVYMWEACVYTPRHGSICVYVHIHRSCACVA